MRIAIALLLAGTTITSGCLRVEGSGDPRYATTTIGINSPFKSIIRDQLLYAGQVAVANDTGVVDFQNRTDRAGQSQIDWDPFDPPPIRIRAACANYAGSVCLMNGASLDWEMVGESSVSTQALKRHYHVIAYLLFEKAKRDEASGNYEAALFAYRAADSIQRPLLWLESGDRAAEATAGLDSELRRLEGLVETTRGGDNDDDDLLY